MKKQTLYYRAANKSIREWSIYFEDGQLHMEHGVVGGESVSNSEPIEHGLGGRSVEEQVEMRIHSRIQKKRYKGYVDTIEEAQNNEPRNALGYKKPAKCKAYNGTDGTFFAPGFTGIQMKLNGHHASVVNDGGKYVMYSSNGLVIDTMPEIIEGLNIPEGRTIEGELYHHGTPLQTISSWVKKRQPETDLLEYHVYDLDIDVDYVSREQDIMEIISKAPRCIHTHTDYVAGEFKIEPLLKKALKGKYEGLIFRLEGHGHEDGKRGKGLIKVKPRHFKNFRVDDEFLVINIVPSVDGWARLVCVTELGKEFKVSCHGDMAYKTHVLKNKENFIGKHIKMEFESYTKGKKPFHPVAMDWREKFKE